MTGIVDFWCFLTSETIQKSTFSFNEMEKNPRLCYKQGPRRHFEFGGLKKFRGLLPISNLSFLKTKLVPIK